MDKNWDVAVIGGGHAGCEAAHICATLNKKTLLISQTLDNIGQMSCNPAIGGVAKGHLVKEIDALGGIMGFLADETGIQFRRLNTKKGPAVQSTRCQSDMIAYRTKMRSFLENTPNLELFQREVTELIWKRDQVIGVRTNFDEEIYCKSVIITTGTFMNGLIHIGKKKFSAGRAWEFASKNLSEHLQDRGLLMGRLKTGTTPRLNRHTIDYTGLEIQHGEEPLPKFSFWDSKIRLPQVPCHITYTNSKTKEIIETNLDRSAMYGGDIESIGPRYCPSIEDKVVKFPDRDRHQIFLEPTALESVEIYPNGISTSMPLEVQLDFLRSIEGLKNVEVMRPGYAIEYDFVFPHQLTSTLEVKDFKNLFLAGQINGTTGYEEAAAQGLIAGINACQKIDEKKFFILRRHESYIGVLIDDLISKGTDEPYRMFTSRAEYRLLLREDNADLRLSPTARFLGLIDDRKQRIFEEKYERIEKLKTYLNEEKIRSDELLSPEGNETPKTPTSKTLRNWLKNSEISIQSFEDCPNKNLKESLSSWHLEDKKIAEADIKYEGYIIRQQNQLKQYLKIDAVPLPVEMDYSSIGGLSNEVKEKLQQHRPQNFGQAKKIMGMTPAGVSILMVYLRNLKKNKLKTK